MMFPHVFLWLLYLDNLVSEMNRSEANEIL